MESIKTNHTEKIKPSVITIGTFDGVHIGHQKIINRLIEIGKTLDLKSVVLTFFPHPRMVLQKKPDLKLLNTIEERKDILESLGLDEMVVKTFTKEFANLSAEEFVKTVLVNSLHIKYVIIGYDHQFGKDRSANIDDLKFLGEKYGFEVEEISAQDVMDVSVSSTKIRTALNQGDVVTANAYLGYSYFLTGQVIKGKGLGKKLGFPTANIHVEKDYKLIPKDGVYVIKSMINNNAVFGMMNIGNNPTVEGKHQSIEAHLFDFDSDIYGKTLKIEILHRLRDEYKFGSLDSLKAQLEIDRTQAKAFFKNRE